MDQEAEEAVRTKVLRSCAPADRPTTTLSFWTHLEEAHHEQIGLANGRPPKDRRVLVIGIPKDTGPQIHQEPEMVIGHWHHQHEDFVCAALAADLRKGVPPKFQVIYWAEIEPPPDIKLRPLTKRDTHA